MARKDVGHLIRITAPWGRRPVLISGTAALDVKGDTVIAPRSNLFFKITVTYYKDTATGQPSGEATKTTSSANPWTVSFSKAELVGIVNGPSDPAKDDTSVRVTVSSTNAPNKVLAQDQKNVIITVLS